MNDGPDNCRKMLPVKSFPDTLFIWPTSLRGVILIIVDVNIRIILTDEKSEYYKNDRIS